MSNKVVKIARDAGECERVMRECEEELKERLWREVWRDMVELEGVRRSVRRVDDWYEITVEI